MDLLTPIAADDRLRRDRRPFAWSLRLLAVAWLAMAQAAPADDPAAAEKPRALPEPIRTTQPVFTIPFRLAESRTPDAEPTRVLLSVSRDLGSTWEEIEEAPPRAQQFIYRAPADGEYWFRLQAEDGQGRRRGGLGPDVRVILNASGPRLAARTWIGPDGEVVCRFAAFDDSLDLGSLRLDYRTTAEPTWQSVAAVGLLSRESPAHMVGEELWWAGDNPAGLTVRLAIRDAAGNETVRQFTLEPSDPDISQHDLAREIGAPPLPGAPPPPQPEPALAAHGSAADLVSGGAGPGPRPPWSADAPGKEGQAVVGADSWQRGAVDAGWPGASSQPPRQGAFRSVLTTARQDSPSAGAGLTFGGPAAAGGEALGGRERPASGRELSFAALASQDHFAPAAMAEDGLPVETLHGLADGLIAANGPTPIYRGKPLRLCRSRRFAWDYELDQEAVSKPIQVELWGTRDGGVTWQRVAVDNDLTSPIEVAVQDAGLHGFRLEVVPVGTTFGGPRSGESPDCWVGIDDVAPVVEITSVQATSQPGEDGTQTLAIEYVARDPLMLPSGVRLQFSPHPEGPWATIVEGLAAAGRYLWTPGRMAPARVYLRAEAADAAGNVGQGVLPDAVDLGRGRQVGRLGGLRPLTGDPTP